MEKQKGRENNPSKTTLFWILRKFQIQDKNPAMSGLLLKNQTTKLSMAVLILHKSIQQ